MAVTKMTTIVLIFLGILLTVVNAEKENGKYPHDKKFENMMNTGVLGTLERVKDDTATSMFLKGHAISDFPQIHSYGIRCYGTEMIVDVEFTEIFNGVIYAEGFRDKEDCVFVNWQSGRKQYVFSLQANKCGSKIVTMADGTAKQSKNHLVIRSKKTSAYTRNPHDILYLSLHCFVKDCDAAPTPPPEPTAPVQTTTNPTMTTEFDKPRGPPMTYNPCSKNNKSRLCDIIF